jgi:hypothetical protein
VNEMSSGDGDLRKFVRTPRFEGFIIATILVNSVRRFARCCFLSHRLTRVFWGQVILSISKPGESPENEAALLDTLCSVRAFSLPLPM